LGQRDADRLIDVLEGGFRAAIRGGEDVSAADLAFSLAQDVSAIDDLRRDGGRVRLPGLNFPITEVGHDYVQAGAWLVPLDRAILAIGGEARPRDGAQMLLGRLRLLAREAAGATVGVGEARSIAGIVVKATTAHLVVRNAQIWAIPLPEIVFVRLFRGGSKGVP